MRTSQIRKMLEDERNRLNTELGRFSATPAKGDRSVSPFNRKMEAVNQITEMEQRLMKARRMQQQVADIEHALEKINKGTYGVCDSCERPIAADRLQAMPQACLCLECKNNRPRTPLRSYAR